MTAGCLDRRFCRTCGDPLWFSHTGISRIPVAGGSPTVVFDDGPNGKFDGPLVVDATGVIFVSGFARSGGAILRVPK